MNPPPTIAPAFPTESVATGCNETVTVGDAVPQGSFVYGGVVTFSIGEPGNPLDDELVEDAIDYAPAVALLAGVREIDEHDFPVGGPFGA